MPTQSEVESPQESRLLYPHVVSFVLGTPWALLPQTLAVMVELLSLRSSGLRLTAEEIAERIGARPTAQDRFDDAQDLEIDAAAPRRSYRVSSQVAVLPVMGVISQRSSFLGDSSGGTSVEGLTQRFREAMADPEVGGIVLDVDSPGGSVFGIQEFADEIHAAHGKKPVIAQANSLAASAAYWLASQADELIVTPSGEVGSIGVLAAHEDLSAKLAQEGIATTLVYAGKYKAEASQFAPLSEDARANIQSRVNDYYDAFVASVARGRNTSQKSVREGFGQGRVVGAQAAVREGMANAIGTLDETVSRLARRLARKGDSAAAGGSWEPLYEIQAPAASEPAATAPPADLSILQLKRRMRSRRLALS